jgi:hypothetical protein
MSEVILHAGPRWGDVVLEQIRVVGLSLRREAFVIAVVLGTVTCIIGADILGGGPGFDARDVFPTPLLSFFYPFAVWRGERRNGPGFLWTLPVERKWLALARVFAGWVWLTAVLAFFSIWLLTLGALGGVSLAHTIARIPFVATMAAYLIGSAVVVGLRHPWRWLVGAAGLLFLLGLLGDLVRRGPIAAGALLDSGVFRAVERAAASWEALPATTQWAITTFLSLATGLAALWAAASRHKENR